MARFEDARADAQAWLREQRMRHPATICDETALAEVFLKIRDERQANERLRAAVKDLRAALGECAVPLHALRATECDAAGRALAPTTKRAIVEACAVLNATLTATADLEGA